MKKIPVGAFLFYFFWMVVFGGENGKGFWLERQKLKTSQGGLFQGLLSSDECFCWLVEVSFIRHFLYTIFVYVCALHQEF